MHSHIALCERESSRVRDFSPLPGEKDAVTSLERRERGTREEPVNLHFSGVDILILEERVDRADSSFLVLNCGWRLILVRGTLFFQERQQQVGS